MTAELLMGRSYEFGRPVFRRFEQLTYAVSLKELFLMRQGIAFHVLYGESLTPFDIFMQSWTERAIVRMP